MSALVTDPSTHATWSPSLNGDRAWVIAAVNDWARQEYEREDPITAEDLEVAQREAREEANTVCQQSKVRWSNERQDC